MALVAKNKKIIDMLIPAFAGGLVSWNAHKGKKDIQSVAVLGIIVFLIVWLVTRTITKAISDKELTLAAEKATNDAAANLQSQLNIDETTVNKVKTIAQRIYRAFHDSWTEDEAEALAAVNTLNSVAEVTATCSIYQAAYGKSLKADFDKYVHWWNGTPISLVKENWF